jgi:hypothetical protein
MAESDSRAVDDLVIHFAQYVNAHSSDGEDVIVDWKTLVHVFTSEGFFFEEDKHNVGLLIPVKFKQGTNTKEMSCVEFVSMCILDFDELTKEQYEKVISRIEEESLEAIVYSSWGHIGAKPLYKFRVIIPLAENTYPDDWTLLWPQINNMFEGLADPKCADCSHGYFLPSAPPGAKASQLILQHYEGNPLNVDELLESILLLPDSDAEDVATAGNREVIPRERVKAFAKHVSRSKNEYKSWMGQLLLKVLAGDVFAERGGRDDTLYKLAGDLGQAFPDADASALAELFEPSLAKMGSDCPKIPDVRKKIQRAQKRVVLEQRAEQRAKTVQEKQVREVLGGDYTKEYIDQFCKDTGSGSKFELFGKRLIVQKGSKYYLFSHGKYYPFEEKELYNASRDLLLPAQKLFRVSINNVSDKGLDTPKPVIQLVNDYGVVAVHKEMRLFASASYYEEASRTFVEAPSPLRIKEGVRRDAVERWIDSVCANEEIAECFRDWLAVLPNLRRALAMIVFTGASGVGKTSFASGIARLWTTSGFTKMGQAWDDFNDAITQCPVLLADESLPTDKQGRSVPTDRIRELISAGSHQLNVKNMKIQKLQGYLRLVAALNNESKLSNLGKVDGRNDVDAIQQRLFLVKIPDHKAAQSAKLFDYEKFVDQDWLAEHALYLMENRQVSERNRFGIRRLSGENNIDVILGDERIAQVFDWLLWYLETRKYDVSERSETPAFCVKGRLYVNSELFAEHMYDHLKGSKPRNELKWSRSDFLRVFNLISSDESVRVHDVVNRKSRRRYNMIDKEMLLKYADNAGRDSQAYSLLFLQHTKRSSMLLPAKMRLTDEDLEVEDAAKMLSEKIWQQEALTSTEQETLPILLRFYEQANT